MIRCVFLLLMLFCVFGCNETTKDVTTGNGLAAKTNETSETRVYEVFGMDCPGCHEGLENLVKKIPAIQGAKANWINKQLTVAILPGSELNDEDVYDAIRRANLTPGKQAK
jgi:hypothetical protein